MSSAASLRRIKVTEMDVIKPFALLMSANVLVLVLWTLLSPLQFQRSVDAWTDQWGRTLSTHGSCVATTERKGGAIPYIVLLAVIDLCAVVLANVQAYRARNIHTEYSESRYIAMVNGSLLQAWLTGAPIIVLVRDNPSALFVVGALILFLTSTAILLLIFVPKLDFLRRKAVHKRRSLTRRSSRDGKKGEARAPESISTSGPPRTRKKRGDGSVSTGLFAKRFLGSANGSSFGQFAGRSSMPSSAPSVSICCSGDSLHVRSGDSREQQELASAASNGLQVAVSEQPSFEEDEEGNSAAADVGLRISIADVPVREDGLIANDEASSLVDGTNV